MPPNDATAPVANPPIAATPMPSAAIEITPNPTVPMATKPREEPDGDEAHRVLPDGDDPTRVPEALPGIGAERDVNQRVPEEGLLRPVALVPVRVRGLSPLEHLNQRLAALRAHAGLNRALQGVPARATVWLPQLFHAQSIPQITQIPTRTKFESVHQTDDSICP